MSNDIFFVEYIFLLQYNIFSRVGVYMICKNCGIKHTITDRFCSNCGSKLVINKNNHKDISFILGLVCLVMSFILNIICFIPGIISIIYACKYKKVSGKYGAGFGLSLGGMIFSFIVFIVTICLYLLIFISVDESKHNIDDYGNNYVYVDYFFEI